MNLPRLRRSLMATLLVAVSTIHQGCSSTPSTPAAKVEQSPFAKREAAEKQFKAAFAERDRKEFPAQDLVSQVNVRQDRIEFTSSAGGGEITCVFREMGKIEVVPTLLTRIGEVKLTGCNKDISLFFWKGTDADAFISAVEGLKRQAMEELPAQR